MAKTGTAPGTTTLTLPGGKTIALADWIDDKHWTTVQLQTGDTDTLQAFTSGRSQQIPGGTRGLTIGDTNIPSSGTNGLPKAWEFMVYGWAVEIMRLTRPDGAATEPVFTSFSDPATLRSWFDLNRRMFLQYIFNGKMYTQGLMEDYPQGHGVHLFTTNPTTEIAQNGVPSPRDRVALVLPVRERELLGYTMEVTPVAALVINQNASDGGTDLTFMDLRITKNGLIKRTVV
jgi:hypothetical protein